MTAIVAVRVGEVGLLYADTKSSSRDGSPVSDRSGKIDILPVIRAVVAGVGVSLVTAQWVHDLNNVLNVTSIDDLCGRCCQLRRPWLRRELARHGNDFSVIAGEVLHMGWCDRIGVTLVRAETSTALLPEIVGVTTPVGWQVAIAPRVLQEAFAADIAPLSTVASTPAPETFRLIHERCNGNGISLDFVGAVVTKTRIALLNEEELHLSPKEVAALFA